MKLKNQIKNKIKKWIEIKRMKWNKKIKLKNKIKKKNWNKKNE